ncbi:MAG: hypothetical protein KDD47_06350, partial [Acidobacteria bacterium]|nr:hypothetical protein [Acidobacteriota bacterium]
MSKDKAKPEEKTGRFPAYLGAVAALIGAMMPLSAFISGWYGVQAEREKFRTQMRLNYLDRALDTTRSAAYREGVLRFLLQTIEPSDPLYQWATDQAQIAQEILRLEGQIAKLDGELETSSRALSEERERRAKETTASAARETDLTREVQTLRSERSRLKEALRKAEEKAGRPSTGDPASSAVLGAIDRNAEEKAGRSSTGESAPSAVLDAAEMWVLRHIQSAGKLTLYDEPGITDGLPYEDEPDRRAAFKRLL